jgi:hypothetical protein
MKKIIFVSRLRARFEVLTAVVTKTSIFWNITQSYMLKVSEEHIASIFSVDCSLLFSCINPEFLQACYVLQSNFLLGLFFDSECGDDIFVRNFGCLHCVVSQTVLKRSDVLFL